MENGFGDLEIWREIYLGRNSLLERKSFLYNMSFMLKDRRSIQNQ